MSFHQLSLSFLSRKGDPGKKLNVLKSKVDNRWLEKKKRKRERETRPPNLLPLAFFPASAFYAAREPPRTCVCVFAGVFEKSVRRWCVRWNPICLKIVCVPLTWFHSQGEDDDVRFNACRARWKRRRRQRRRRRGEDESDRSIWRMLPSVLVLVDSHTVRPDPYRGVQKRAGVPRDKPAAGGGAHSLAKFRVNFCRVENDPREFKKFEDYRLIILPRLKENLTRWHY